MSLITFIELEKIAQKRNLSKSISEANLGRIYKNASPKSYDIFLSHSFTDATHVEILKDELERLTGCSIYVDWLIDKELNRAHVTAETANRLRHRLREAKCLLYAFSVNAKISVWTPWELGFLDGNKGKVALIPLTDVEQTNFCGVEYLGLYPFVDKAPIDGKSEERFWIQNQGKGSKSVELSKWIKAEDSSKMLL